MKVVCLFIILVCYANSSIAQQMFEEPIIKSIYFGGGSYHVNQEQREALYHFLDSIPEVERYQITLNSHTDSIGGKHYNQWLAEMRSQSVMLLLKKVEKLNPYMIDIQDFGMSHPLYDNHSWMGRRGNRRVDIIV